MLVLGIETSCDETAASVIKDGRKVLSNTVASSLEFHKKYGGVVPEIATRYHVEVINYVVEDSLRSARARLGDIDLLAVTYGPGLVGSLLVGISFAKSLGYCLKVPLIGVNHLWAHIYSGLINKSEIKYPFVGLIVSGGHTALVFCEGIDKFELIGQTKDDAVGEAFDKVAKILGLGYPGGPAIEKLALETDTPSIKFVPENPEIFSYDFSFSGIKTAVLYYIRGKRMDRRLKADVAASFQRAVVDYLARKSFSACRAKGVSCLVVGGGVIANNSLREALTEKAKAYDIDVVFPEFEFSLDNAAMVAAMGYRLFKKGVRSDFTLTAEPNLGIQ